MNVLLFIASLIGSIYFYSSIHEIQGTDNWKRVQAILNVLETPSYEKMINQSYREFKRFKVNYSYSYKNKKYNSNQLSLSSMGTLRGHQVDAIVKENKWKEGGQTIVFVNPKNPREATMLGSKGVSKDIWISFYFCLLLMVSGLVGMIRTLMDLFED